MQALNRDVPSTAKSVSTTRSRTSCVSDAMRIVLSQNENEAEEGGGRCAGDVERDFGHPQAGDDRLHDPDADPDRDEPPEQRGGRRPGGPWRSEEGRGGEGCKTRW